MLQIRRSDERGFAFHGWLESRHTFSFADYYDPHHMGFGPLRVINEDRIQGGSGFGAHPHRDMEIISYVVQGSLLHQDSMGNKAIIRPGEVQRMTAGTGVVHSEYNGEKDQETHFFQIWIQPRQQGVKPGYGQKSFEQELNSRKLVLVVSADGRDGSIEINQDTNIYLSRIKSGDTLDFLLNPARGLWVQVIKGRLLAGALTLHAGDALSTRDAQNLHFVASEDSEMILFELA
jgi:quercetin 2,3-dioxygenase